MRAKMQAGEQNQFDAKGLNIFMGTEGQAYCLSEAPNAEAVIKSHEAAGVPQSKENIVEVNSLV